MSGSTRWDARVPLRFGAASDAGPGDAVLDGAGWAAPGAHGPGCACCAPRGAAAQALSDLFMRRARGSVEFRAVLVVAGDGEQTAVRAALAADPVVSARFRLA